MSAACRLASLEDVDKAFGRNADERPEQRQNVWTAGERLFAERYCARCDVRQRCHEAAVARNEKYGVWGGQSPPLRDGLSVDSVKMACAWCEMPFYAAPTSTRQYCGRVCKDAAWRDKRSAKERKLAS